VATPQAASREEFDALVEPHRRELQAHCYRMLGSLQDAEDALQDTLLRAWRGLESFEGHSSLRTWLYRIATNASLDVAARRKKAPILPADHGPSAVRWDDPPPGESVLWLEPLPGDDYEHRESVELAFAAALQHLPPNQRAALILRDVLGFSAQEVAAWMATSEASVKSALQRARATMDERGPDRTQQATLHALGNQRTRSIVQAYSDAIESGDVETVLALLTEDATWAMPPYATWFAGRDAIAAFLADAPLTHAWRHLPTAANGQPAVGCFIWDDVQQAFMAEVIDVLSLDERGRIKAITAFVDPALFPRFGLPARIDA
jgi:RNA polymerase sigma-70 factor (ECF subfamily)